MYVESITMSATLRNFIAENLLYSDDGFAYSDDASFLEEGIINSLGVIELVLFVEQQCGVPVDDQDVTPENFDSITRLTNYMLRKMSAEA